MKKTNKKIIYLAIVLIAANFPSLALARTQIPNDTFYSEQEEYFSQINLQKAWEKTTGSDEVVIAVINSGVDMDHPDIIGNMWFNPGEKALNGVDDDNNGYVDDLNGWDFLIGSPDPHPKFDDGYSFEAMTHGTSVAGIAASVTDNNKGLAGVCRNCKIMALRAVESTGLGDMSVAAKAIDYAVDNGADIINMSFVGSEYQQAIAPSIKRAHEAGVVLVAAVGNDAQNSFTTGGDLDVNPLYPVCLDGGAGSNNVVGVGSVDFDNKKSTFSNYGSSCIDINAPGTNIAAPQIYAPNKGVEYGAKYLKGVMGTSFSAPFVSGAAGLIKSVNSELSPDQVASILRSTAAPVDKENPKYSGQLGEGLLDVKAALDLAEDTEGSGAAFKFKIPDRKNILISSYKNRKVEIIITDKAGAESARWLAYPEFFKSGAEVVSGDVDSDGEREIIAGAGEGGGPQVRVFNQQGKVESQFFAYDESFRGGVHVASGDLNKDGVAEIITSAGAGLSSEIKIFDYPGRELQSFEISAEGLKGGMTVSAGDVTGDGYPDIITGTGGGSLPIVGVFDIVNNDHTSWLAYPEFFRGGVNVAIGDVDGDGVADIVTSAGETGGPQVRVFDKDGNAKYQFFAFEESFRGGAHVAVGRIDSGSHDKIIVGSGPGRESEARVFNLFGSKFVQESVFHVFESDYKGGVRVGM